MASQGDTTKGGAPSTRQTDWREGEILSCVLFRAVAGVEGVQAAGHLSLTILPMDSAEPVTGRIADGPVFEAARERDLAGEIVSFRGRDGRIEAARFASSETSEEDRLRADANGPGRRGVQAIGFDAVKELAEMRGVMAVFAAVSERDLLKAARSLRERGDDEAADRLEALSKERRRAGNLLERVPEALDDETG